MDELRRIRTVPVVGQNRASLPDGAVDPEHSTDCGEACCSAVMAYFGYGFLPPGCVRAWLGRPGGSGETTGPDLASLLSRLRLKTSVEYVEETALQAVLEAVFQSGGLGILLGAWVAPSLQHWNVTHMTVPEGVWCMDPWWPARLLRKWADLESLYGGELVVCHAG